LNKTSLERINKKSWLYAKGYAFGVSDNKVEGYIYPFERITRSINLKDVIEIFKLHGIQYGIIKPALLQETLDKNPKPTDRWIIAIGKPPVSEEPATIVYHFETDPLKIGTLKETGYMDYKDRGVIPTVKAGTMMAEKVLGAKGKPGIDIYGEPVPPPKPPDIRLRRGKGVELSADGFKALAKTNGRPVKSADGKVYVFEDLCINGDIGIRTGHVIFEGHVEATGSVNTGYKVMAGSLLTRGINNAQCDIVSNINVLGGVSGASLKSGGNFRARYIQNSTIEAMGDVIVDRDVSNSTIISGGTVIVDNGKILTSTVQARNGITASGIGSKSSETCELIVGIDHRIDAAVGEINAQISENVQKRTELEAILAEGMKKSETIQQTIANATRVQVGTQSKLSLLAEKLKTLEPGAKADAWKIKSKIDMLRTASDRSTSTITKLREDLQMMLEEIENIKDQIEVVEEAISHLEDEIRQLDESSRIKEGVFERNPVVDIRGTIHAGTSIRGPHASLIVRDASSQVRIVEVKLKKETAKPWRMVLKKL
jgi:hypothetical protein